MINKRFILGATAALISAGVIVETQAGSASLDRIEIVDAEAAPVRRAPREAMADSGGATGAVDDDLATVDDTLASNPTGASDAQLLLAAGSP